MRHEIKFGTDGWRGVIGFDFIDEKIKVISAGISDYLNEKTKMEQEPSQPKYPRAVVGYDTRFLSNRFAHSAASVLSMNGVETLLSDKYISTPALSVAVVQNKADLGIMLTASHNPFYYNGYKIKGPYGGSATPDLLKPIEEKVNFIHNNKELKFYLNNQKHEGSPNGFTECDFLEEYKKYVLSQVDAQTIKENFNFPLVLDPMYGAGQKTAREIFQGLSTSQVHEIHSCINTSFGGINPEPIGENLNDAVRAVKDKKCALAICLDGDGDRIGVIGENGNFVSSHHIFAIILNYLLKYKKLKGKVVKTVSTSSIIDRMCAKRELEMVTTPIGFKYIGEEILSGGVMMGGEESGGLWVQGYLPERDGIFIGLVLLEVLCTENKSINEILKDIYNEYGYFVYRRADYEIDNEKKERLRDYLGRKVPEILKNEIVGKPITLDGFKYVLKDGSWIMLRPSGTESVVRIYAESNTSEKLDCLHNIGRKILDSV